MFPSGSVIGALPLAVVLVPRAIHFDARLSPLLSHAVGLLTVNVERTVTRKFVSYNLGKVDREVPISTSEGIGVVVERRFEACPFEPGDRASHVSDLEDRLESGDQPGSRS